MFQLSVLPNGLRVLTSSMPYTRSVCVSIFVGAGSRYESDRQSGVSHFIEHLCFKGTERRPSARAISEAIESVGGVLNGGTDRELTVYWCKVARPHFQLGHDLLVDMLRHSRFLQEDVEKERRVIFEELNMIMDSPHERVDTLIDEVMWPAQPLGRDVAGTKESVGAINRDDLLAFLASQYGPANCVVSIAGDIGHDEVTAAVGESLGDWARAAPQPWEPARDEQAAPRAGVEWRSTEQAHVCISLPGLSSHDPDRFALDLLNVVLGEGMSSRLFEEIREKQCLAYDVHSYVSHFLDAGALTVYAGVDPSHINAAVRAILHELSHLPDGVPEEELRKARELSKGRLLLRMEDTRSVSSWAGVQELLLGQVRTVDEIIALIDATTPEDLRRVAERIINDDKLNLAVVGPYRSQRRFLELLHF